MPSLLANIDGLNIDGNCISDPDKPFVTEVPPGYIMAALRPTLEAPGSLVMSPKRSRPLQGVRLGVRGRTARLAPVAVAVELVVMVAAVAARLEGGELVSVTMIVGASSDFVCDTTALVVMVVVVVGVMMADRAAR